jgi:VCBS repeat-containing protein
VTGPGHGTVGLNPDGSFAYTPAVGFAGRDSFTYKASDGLADSDAATVTITVDTPPVASNDGYRTAEDTPLTVAAPGVLANDTDADGDPLTASLVAGPTHGTLTLHADGSFAYTPAANFNGSDAFTYKANDGRANSNTATVAVTVSEVNDPPTAAADQATLAANTSTVVDVTANDAPGPANEAGQALAVGSVGQPAHGQAAVVTGGADAGKVSYTPVADYAGPDAFTYTVCDDGTTDGHADPKCDTASVDVTVTAPASGNHAPAAQDDGYGTDEDTPLTVAPPGVLANDGDADGDPLTAALVTGPGHGTVGLNPDGSFASTPAANFNGSDAFTYQASDGRAYSNVATVTITVAAVPDAPLSQDDGYKTREDTPLTTPAPGVLANDSDGDGDPLTVARVTGPAHGTLTLNPDGSFTYAPAANFNGSDTFTYQASDGSLTSNLATVTITVSAVPDAPIARDDSYSTNKDTPLQVPRPGVLANDSDADGDRLHAVPVTGPAAGRLTLNDDGSFSYTPAAGFFGQDSFTYKASDGLKGGNTSNVATVTITVLPPPGTPLARDDSYNANQDTPLVVPAPGVLANDSDPDGDPLTAVLVGGSAKGTTAHGMVSLSSNGAFRYTPATKRALVTDLWVTWAALHDCTPSHH